MPTAPAARSTTAAAISRASTCACTGAASPRRGFRRTAAGRRSPPPVWPTSSRWVSHLSRFFTGIEIHPAARLGRGLFIDHGMGVVIGETSEVGENVTLYQGVSLAGTSLKKEKRHPTLGNNVTVGAGAKVIGGFTIGDSSRVGAGSVVVREVPPNSVVVGVPGRVT